MNTLLIAIGAAVFYLVAYFTYGKWLGNKLFQLSAKAVTPAIELEDGADYVPTSKGIVFGHHFTSIAGTGPIVGPALAVIWGWLPALIWVLLGSVFIGAVHDFGSLVVSLRNKGQTVGDIAGRVLTTRARVLFLCILFLSLTIVLAIFGLVIAAVFRTFPESILPCLLQIPLAVLIGLFIHKRGGNLVLPSLLSLGLMYAFVYFGDSGILATWNSWLAGQSNMWWVSVLLIYSFIASVLPVWILLQPRDYINSLQLLSTMGLVVVGLIVCAFFGGAADSGVRPALELSAPAVNSTDLVSVLPEMMPFLFITIACGAISGFHCLVCSGTSSKQLKHEPDARFVGYGSMLTEGFLAVIVILACVAGIGLGIKGSDGQTLLGEAAWLDRYSSWNAMKGLGAKVGAFVDGSANFLKGLGFKDSFAQSLMGVFVASFAATTLDSACRLQRYVIQEIARIKVGSQNSSNSSEQTKPVKPRKSPLAFLENTYAATAFAVITAFILAYIPLPGTEWSWENGGKGGLLLWPLFGATNQLLAGLAFLVVVFWLRQSKKPIWFIVIPAIFMLVLPFWAMWHQIFFNAIGSEQSWIEQKNWLVVTLGLITIILEIWMIIEAFIALRRKPLR